MVRVKWPGGRPFKMDIDCRTLYTKNESASAVLHLASETRSSRPARSEPTLPGADVSYVGGSTDLVR